jgi:hypothetical protein
MFHVEHYMNSTKFILFILISLSFGCRQPIPDPQSSDYIYQDLKTQLGVSETKLAERKTQLDEHMANMKTVEGESEKKRLRFKADIAVQDIRKLEEKVKYWKLKILSREEYVRNEYLREFNKGNDWNNSEEVERYKKAISRLVVRAPAGKGPPEKKKSGGGEHGEGGAEEAGGGH